MYLVQPPKYLLSEFCFLWAAATAKIAQKDMHPHGALRLKYFLSISVAAVWSATTVATAIRRKVLDELGI